MKFVVHVFALVAAGICASASAAVAPARGLVGRWAVDVASLPMPPEMRPQRVTLEFSDPGNGRWSTQVDIVDPAGTLLHAATTLPLDGTPGHIEGNYWADVCAIRMAAPNVLVMQLVDHGAPASTRVYTVSTDGATLTETKAFFTKDGAPVLQTNLFKRLQ